MNKKNLMIFVSTFSLVACVAPVSDASVTPYAGGTERAFSSPTPWVAGTQTALAVASPTALPPLPAPTFTPPAMEKPADFSPVLYGKKYDANTFFLLLGGVSRDAWLAPEVSMMRFAGEATYSLHTLQQGYKYFFWGKTPDPSPTCNSFTIGTDINVDETGMVAVLDGWDVTKRTATELSAESEFYRQVVIDWLAAMGVASPQPENLQIFRVDIEGDGTDEVFISATHLDDSQHTTKAGDYSIILMRKVVGNNVVTKFVTGDQYNSQQMEMTFPRTFSLANFMDLNQDGVLEVVVDIRGWEKFGAIVVQIDGQDVIKRLGAEC